MPSGEWAFWPEAYRPLLPIWYEVSVSDVRGQDFVRMSAVCFILNTYSTQLSSNM
jgi:hypothetical protein